MFQFKQFTIDDSRCGMKIGTDGVLIGAWATTDIAEAGVPMRVLDVGAGSGLLALMVAQRAPHATIDAVEVDLAAVADCAQNVEASPWRERITTICEDINSYHPRHSYDLIISNPPFFATGEHAPDASRACARHENTLSPKTLIDLAGRILSPTGRLAMITTADNPDDIIFHAEMHRLRLRGQCSVCTVNGKKPIRILWEFSPEDGIPEITSLTIRNSDGSYTPQYINLTKPFYINI